MSNGDDGAFVLLEMLLQPVDTLRIKMVGWLIEEQYVWLLEQQTAERNATTLTARKSADTPISRRTVKSCHCTIKLRINVPSVSAVNNILEFCLSVHELVQLVWILKVFRFGELHIHLLIFCQGVVNILDAFHDILLYGFGLIELWILLQITY